MGLLYRDKDGNETPIAGTQVTGELVPSISHYQSGTITADTTGTYKEVPVSFDSPMPDTDYIVNVSQYNGAPVEVFVERDTVTKNGFTIYVAQGGNITVKWQAFKLMTEQSYQLDSNQIATNKTNIANLQTTNFVNYSLNTFEPISDTTHIDNWTMSVTRAYMVEKGASIPATLVGDWFSIINWQSVHFQSQIWVNSAGATWSRFRYRAGGQGQAWSNFQRLDNGPAMEVYDWSGSLNVTAQYPFTVTERYVRAKPFGNHYEIFGKVVLQVTPNVDTNLIHYGWNISGRTGNVTITQAAVAGRADSLATYVMNGDGYVGFYGSQFAANQTYEVVLWITGLVT